MPIKNRSELTKLDTEIIRFRSEDQNKTLRIVRFDDGCKNDTERATSTYNLTLFSITLTISNQVKVSTKSSMNVTKMIYENVIDETERDYIFFVIILSKYQHDSIT